MRRRITVLATMTALFAVLLLAVPLAIFAANGYVNDERLELQRAAATAAAAVRGDRPQVAPMRLSRTEIIAAVYDTSGRLIDGSGPTRGGPLIQSAARSTEATTTSSNGIAVAAPVSDGDQVTAVVLLRTDLHAAHHRALIAALVITAISAAAVLIAAIGARFVSRKLAAPIDRLRESARRLGAGDLDARVPASGVAEFDALSTTLNEAALRIQNMLGRERSLSAEVSHQLRTPLTGLRLDLEALQQSYPRDTRVLDAAASVDRLTATITDIIALARDVPGQQETSIGHVLTGVAQRWHGLLAADTRPLHVSAAPNLPKMIAVSTAATTQILDILIDNAHTHGSGAVTVHARALGPAVAFDVSDEGPRLTLEPHRLFAGRNINQRGGIGLPLARKLAEAEHARVTLTSAEPPTFTFVARRADTPGSGTTQAQTGASTRTD